MTFPRITALIKSIANGRTVLMVEHNLRVVEEISDHITVLSRGSILADGDYASVSRNAQGDRGISRRRGGTTMTHNAPVLSVRDLHGWYGESHVLQGINFDVNEGEIATLLGPQWRRQDHHATRHHGVCSNAAPATFCSTGAQHWQAGARGCCGVRPSLYCPEERGIFSRLTSG
jgi:ABC-type lipopolysaccharide export system ATPase subunit